MTKGVTKEQVHAIVKRDRELRSQELRNIFISGGSVGVVGLEVNVDSFKKQLSKYIEPVRYDDISNWVNQVMIYPLSEIYAGKVAINQKEEKRLEKSCEDIFRFTALKPTDKLLKADLRSSWRELEVVLKLKTKLPVKPELIEQKKKEFLDSAKELIKLLEDTYKREPLLKAYYQEWRVSYQELKGLVYEI